MWRALFLALGITMMILGAECLGVEKVTLKIREKPKQATSSFETPAAQGPKRVVTPPRWAPWSLMSCGAIVCLYSFTLPRRMNGG